MNLALSRLGLTLSLGGKLLIASALLLQSRWLLVAGSLSLLLPSSVRPKSTHCAVVATSARRLSLGLNEYESIWLAWVAGVGSLHAGRLAQHLGWFSVRLAGVSGRRLSSSLDRSSDKVIADADGVAAGLRAKRTFLIRLLITSADSASYCNGAPQSLQNFLRAGLLWPMGHCVTGARGDWEVAGGGRAVLRALFNAGWQSASWHMVLVLILLCNSLDAY